MIFRLSNNTKKKIHEILNDHESNFILSKIFHYFIIALIIVNVLAVIFETVESFYDQYRAIFIVLEVFSVAIFTIEYLFRVWTAVVEKKYKQPIIGRIKYILTPMALIDLFAFLPFYFPLLIPFDLRFIRAFRLFRLLRIFKIGRYSDSFNMLGRVFKNKKNELLFIMLIVSILLVIISSVMYFVEREAQPKLFSSIPAAMWWGVASLTTIGYGDIYPITPAGKILGSIIAILGIGFFALPTGILAAGFVEEFHNTQTKTKICPHCKKEIKG